ncbi:hypothetical protein NCWK1_1529 [Nostoc cycadae WK-1]|uniref:Uncharacterized protein n=2 Tax=Nostoc cycadae TaxID=246795 RepID=A0A2H6LF67_9NOSO|nr:hypothetical protein NCWK1_1529 [Nostoc cycadae WK-1]
MSLSFLVILTIFTQLAFSDCRVYYEISGELGSCAGRLTGRATKIMLGSIENTNFISRPWFVVWVVSASYLYQLEYLVRKYLISKFKIQSQNSQYGHRNYSVDSTDKEIDRLRGDLGLTQMKKGRQTQVNISPQYRNNYQKAKIINGKFLIFLLICLLVIGIFLLAKFTYLKENRPFFITSQVPSIEPSIKEIVPQSDNFRGAVNQAISAANLTQSAKSQTEWQNIVKQWEAAISMMQSVPLSSPNYEIAQQKIIEYQRNLSYAQKNATNSK